MQRKREIIMMFTFNKESRERLVKSIIDELKAEVIDQQDLFDFTYEKLDYLNEGFGFKIIISPRSLEVTAKSKNMFYEIKNYVSDMLDYLLRDEISVSSYVDGTDHLEFEIVSSF